MAHFYGNLKGSRGEATRCGTASSGLSVSARSWSGSVSVELQDCDGRPCVILRADAGSSTGGHILWLGPLADLVNADALRIVR